MGCRRSWIPTTPPRGRGPAPRPSSGASRWARTSAGPATPWSSTGPTGITDAGGLRTQFTHVIDVAPTILSLAGIPEPETVDGIDQEPMHGTSFAASLSPTAPRPNTAPSSTSRPSATERMYKDGWWLGYEDRARSRGCSRPTPLLPTRPASGIPTPVRPSSTTCLTTSRRRRDIAADHPEKVQELKDLFWEEAERYKVLPLLAALSTFFGMVPPIPQETTFEFRGDVQNVMPGMIPRIYNRSYSISADLVVPEGGCRRCHRRRGRPSRRLLALSSRTASSPTRTR